LEAEQLLAYTLDVDRIHLYLNPDRPLDQKELDQFRPLIRERKSGQPLQYITGQTSFMGLSLKIDERALIPRPETEELTEEILAQFRNEKNLEVLDMGTGSGAIAIALSRFLVEPNVTAVDKSPKALELAKKNAEANDSSSKIEFRQSDWFTDIAGRYDIIVSNPPYVATGDIAELKEEIKDHEPLKALDGGEEGLVEIKNILQKADQYLKPESGVIFLEIGHNQGEKVRDFAASQNFTDINLLTDTQGNDRIIHGRKGNKHVENCSNS